MRRGWYVRQFPPTYFVDDFSTKCSQSWVRRHFKGEQAAAHQTGRGIPMNEEVLHAWRTGSLTAGFEWWSRLQTSRALGCIRGPGAPRLNAEQYARAYFGDQVEL